MKTLLLFSLFFSSYLLSSGQYPGIISIEREVGVQEISPGTGEKPEFRSGLGGERPTGQPDTIFVRGEGQREHHVISPGGGTDTTPTHP